MFSGGKERDQWNEMGLLNFEPILLLRLFALATSDFL